MGSAQDAEGVGQSVGPGPAFGQAQVETPGGAGDPGAGVQESVADGFPLGPGQGWVSASVLVSRMVWVQASRSAAVRASISHAWSTVKIRDGSRCRPACWVWRM